jgi:glycosyltransferase involved in cell wall biosynthesis
VTEETRKTGDAEIRCQVLVPAYREAARIGVVVRTVRALGLPVLVVDDGSPDATSVEAEQAGAEVVRHPVNRGKGAAIATGVTRLEARRLDCVLTMDADGQHLAADIPPFLEAFRRDRPAAIVGNRMDHPAGMPFVRRLTNRYMSWLLSRRMGQRVPDTQCGFRLYRADVLRLLVGGDERFAGESEVLLRLSAAGHRIASVPVRVIYRDEKSKISPIRDTIRFWRMLRGMPRGGH